MMAQRNPNRSASGPQVPQVAVKGKRRVLRYASEDLNGKMRCLGFAQRYSASASAQRLQMC